MLIRLFSPLAGLGGESVDKQDCPNAIAIILLLGTYAFSKCDPFGTRNLAGNELSNEYVNKHMIMISEILLLWPMLAL